MRSHLGTPTGVHVVLERDRRVLLMRRANTGFFDGLFSLPGGHVEPGESLRAAAARELAEETGVRVHAQVLEYVGVVHRASDTNRIDFFLRARVWEGTPCICEPDKCDAMDWFAKQQLPASTVDYVRCALACGDGPWLLELGWDLLDGPN